MKLHHALAVLASLVLSGILQAQPVNDAEVAAKLVGTWVIPKEHYTAVLRGGETTLKPDGTFTSFAVLKMKDQQVRIDVQGKWKVEKGVVIEEITKSSKEQIVPLGLVTRDTVLELTDKTYRYRSENGQERLNVRKPPK